MSEREAVKRGLQGGIKATTRGPGRGEPKIGVEEFMSVAERFGFSPETLVRIRSVLDQEDMGEGPFLANYYSNLQETKVQAFERLARETFGARHAIAVSSGTAALHAALVAAGVGPGTEVICSATGFYATAAAVVHSKGVPVFCDVDESLGMDPTKIESLINERTVALAPTHVMGSVCNMEAIMEVARKFHLRVIEDCAQSCGGKYKGKWVGTYGDLGCFSISAYKIVGGGEGGLVLTDEERLWRRVNGLAECGGLWRPVRFAPPRYPGELFCGTNYRLSELEAAVDVVQLARMTETVSRFNHVKRTVLGRLKTYKEIVPQRINDLDGEVGYRLRFFPETLELGERIVADLNALGVQARTRGRTERPDWHIYRYMYAITTQTGATPDGCPWECPIYKERGGEIAYRSGDCPVADDLFDRLVDIPLNQWHADQECQALADAINGVLARHCTEDEGASPWIEA